MPDSRALILLVEDEPDLRGLFSRALEAAGYALISAADGTTGLSIWNEHSADIDLVIVDFHLGRGINGVEVARSVHSQRPETPVLLASGHIPSTWVEPASLYEDCTVLLKPFNGGTLAQAVKNALSNRRPLSLALAR